VSQEIDYVELEIISTSNLKITRKGLLTGITIDESSTFIRILENIKSDLYFDVQYYNIKRLKISNTKGTKQTFYTDNIKEQENALKDIKNIILELRGNGQVDREGAVIMSKYNNLPAKYMTLRAESFKRTSNVFGLKNQLPVTTKPITVVKPPPTITTNKNVYTPPEKKVTYIRRKTKKPSAKFLAKAKKKVAKITNGEYKEKELPKIIEVEDNTAPVGQRMYDDDDYGYMGEYNRFD